MSWYRAIGRPLFFSFPPETAHEMALRLLGLPLPWSAVGGASKDPSLRTTVAGLELRNPVGLAAGFDKGCRRLRSLGSLGFGYVVGGTVTSAPREGNAKPRIARYPERRSMTNAMGLPNPGVEVVAERLARRRRRGPAAELVSLADEDAGAVARNLERLHPFVDGFELNVSCPNVSWGRDVDVETHVSDMLSAVRHRGATPLFVKLPPFRTDAERDAVVALASLAMEKEADGVVASNTRPVADPRLATGRGGLSGRAVFADTLRIVSTLRETLGAGVPISASGGVTDGSDAAACLDAGATTVQIYSALVFEGPGIVGSIASEISEARRRAERSSSSAAA
jgi:dihydroorotate dehydrogenase subfamily 1